YSFDDQSSGALMELSKKIDLSNYTAVVIAPTSKKEAKLFFDKCEENGLPYIQINSYIERESKKFLGYVGQDSFTSGQLAAKLLDISTPDNTDFLLLHLEKDVDNSEHMIAKEKGFKSYVDKQGHNRKVIVKWLPEYDDSDLLEKRVSDILEKEKDINGIFVTTSRISYLATILFKQTKLDISLVGFDLVPSNIDFLSHFKRMFLINQNPSLQGYYSLMQIFNSFIKKQKIKKKMYLPLDIITHENVQNYSHISYRDSNELAEPNL
ncbi:MAG: substrate-binding domain-containing protein, partial [Bacteroidota bacterium]